MMKKRFLAFLLATMVCLGAMTACASAQTGIAASDVNADRADTIDSGDMVGVYKWVELADKGVTAFIKHFAVNHQDTDRGPGLPGMVLPGQSDYGLVTFVDEQTIREIYTKSFQISVEEGHALGLMNSMCWWWAAVWCIPA